MKGEGKIDPIERVNQLAVTIFSLHQNVAHIPAVRDERGIQSRILAFFPSQDQAVLGLDSLFDLQKIHRPGPPAHRHHAGQGSHHAGVFATK